MVKQSFWAAFVRWTMCLAFAAIVIAIPCSAQAQPSGMCDGCTGMMGGGMGVVDCAEALRDQSSAFGLDALRRRGGSWDGRTF
jgi:hypothetical protein